jgi:hypothetical protein
MAETRCINPGEIEEGGPIAYLHGDAAPHVIEHVARCAFCAEQVEQLRMVDAQLLAAFYRDACPAAKVLADFALNWLSAADRLRVAVHVRRCPACSEELSMVRDLADEEPASLLARLRALLALALVARPVAPVAAPARGTGWQGRFEANDLIVTLIGQAGSLTGRVRRREARPDADYSGQAWLLGETATTEETVPSSKIDTRGRFQFASLATGSYALLLQVGDQDIKIEEIQVE